MRGRKWAKRAWIWIYNDEAYKNGEETGEWLNFVNEQYGDQPASKGYTPLEIHEISDIELLENIKSSKPVPFLYDEIVDFCKKLENIRSDFEKHV